MKQFNTGYFFRFRTSSVTDYVIDAVDTFWIEFSAHFGPESDLFVFP